jgi:crossover junction endodeoxyribonuclease RusA
VTAYRPVKAEIVELPVPLVADKPPLTANQRLHHMDKARRAKLVREHVAWRARQAGLSPQDYIIVQLHYQPADRRRRDPSNLVPTQKPAVDALVDAGVVPDDTPQYVGELMPVIHEPGGGVLPRLWLAVSVGVSRPMSAEDRWEIAQEVLLERTQDAAGEGVDQ